MLVCALADKERIEKDGEGVGDIVQEKMLGTMRTVCRSFRSSWTDSAGEGYAFARDLCRCVCAL